MQTSIDSNHPPAMICLTGGIGSGKSTVARALRLRGYEVYDCDREAKLLMEASEDLKREMVRTLGEECIDSTGCIDRRAVAAKVFGDTRMREWLNSQVHAMVREDIGRLRERTRGILFVETAIPVTSRLTQMCASTWYVEAPEETRLLRAMTRDGASQASIRARIEAQAGEFTGLEGAVTIVNDGVSPLLPQIENALSQLPTIC